MQANNTPIKTAVLGAGKAGLSRRLLGKLALDPGYDIAAASGGGAQNIFPTAQHIEGLRAPGKPEQTPAFAEQIAETLGPDVGLVLNLVAGAGSVTAKSPPPPEFSGALLEHPYFPAVTAITGAFHAALAEAMPNAQHVALSYYPRIFLNGKEYKMPALYPVLPAKQHLEAEAERLPNLLAIRVPEFVTPSTGIFPFISLMVLYRFRNEILTHVEHNPQSPWHELQEQVSKIPFSEEWSHIATGVFGNAKVLEKLSTVNLGESMEMFQDPLQILEQYGDPGDTHIPRECLLEAAGAPGYLMKMGELISIATSAALAPLLRTMIEEGGHGMREIAAADIAGAPEGDIVVPGVEQDSEHPRRDHRGYFILLDNGGIRCPLDNITLRHHFGISPLLAAAPHLRAKGHIGNRHVCATPISPILPGDTLHIEQAPDGKTLVVHAKSSDVAIEAKNTAPLVPRDIPAIAEGRGQDINAHANLPHRETMLLGSHHARIMKQNQAPCVVEAEIVVPSSAGRMDIAPEDLPFFLVEAAAQTFGGAVMTAEGKHSVLAGKVHFSALTRKSGREDMPEAEGHIPDLEPGETLLLRASTKGVGKTGRTPFDFNIYRVINGEEVPVYTGTVALTFS